MAKLTSPHIPVAFRLPEESETFRRFASAHPTKRWVTKSNMHRGIRVRSDLDELLQSVSSSKRGAEAFVQEFVESPLLIDGRKFDIGVYVVVTSVR